MNKDLEEARKADVEKAYRRIFNNNNPTATWLQKHFWLSFLYWASIIEELEEKKYISKQVGCKKRRMLVCPWCFTFTCFCWDTAYETSHDHHNW